jgi:cell pole-organizing protein PopZ
MDDILASIRRILSEDETAAGAEPTPAPSPSKPADDGILMLESSMIVPAHEPPPEQAPEPAPMPQNDAQSPAEPRPRDAALLAPETAAAAASSVDALMRTLVAERSTQVNRGGPTIEDLVREEIRPVLKSWLDTHLPPLVERLVRAEIERVSGRAAL